MPRKNNKSLSRCIICSRKPNVNSKVIQCSLCCSISHLKCVSNPKRATSSANEHQQPLSFDKFLCIRCLEDALPFMSLEENDFKLTLFELQHSASPFWNVEKLNSLSFHPFQVDNHLKSKANFVDNFCDPDEFAFKKVNEMTNNCKYFWKIVLKFRMLTNQFDSLSFILTYEASVKILINYNVILRPLNFISMSLHYQRLGLKKKMILVYFPWMVTTL